MKKHLADLLEIEDRHKLATWVIKYGKIKADITFNLAINRISEEEYYKYSEMLMKAFSNKFYKNI